MECVSQALWREISGSQLDHFAFVPALSSVGGIIVGWNSSILDGKVLRVGDYSLTIEFFSKQFLMVWFCTMVYGLVARARKSAFWEELRADVGPPDVPSIVCGDFNAIFALEDKVSGTPNVDDICFANSFMVDRGFWEPPSVGRKFT